VTIPQAFYSPEDVAAKLRLHVRTVRRFIGAGKLKATRIGKQYRIAAADLSALSGASETLMPRTRRVLVSSIVDIDAISRSESDRITTLVASIFTSTRDASGRKRIDSLYYEEQGRLRITIHADVGYTASLLGMINAVLDDGRPIEDAPAS
jgi:excisionase family DNA binding protein